MKQYAWKTPVFSRVSAQVAGEFVEQVIEQHGAATPAVLVEESRPTEAPLHPLYEWDDTVAAEKYREDQSRDILRHLVVIRAPVAPAVDPVPVRAFVNVSPAPKASRTYVGIETALSDTTMRASLIASAKQDLAAFRRKYEVLREVANMGAVFREIDAVLTEEAVRADVAPMEPAKAS